MIERDPNSVTVWISAVPPRRTLLVWVCLRFLVRPLFGLSPAMRRIDWKDTSAEVLARVLVALVIAAVSCVVLFPVVFWPGRRGRPSLYDHLGQPGWIAWVFISLFVGAVLVAILGTRVSLRLTTGDEGTSSPAGDSDPA